MVDLLISCGIIAKFVEAILETRSSRDSTSETNRIPIILQVLRAKPHRLSPKSSQLGPIHG